MRVIVVGSGIVGASCAYHAARSGAEVILVESDLPGRATAAGAGIVCPWTSRVDDEAWHQFAAVAAERYPTLIEQLADSGHADVGYRKVGALSLFPTVEERDQFQRSLLHAHADTPEMGAVQALSSEEATALFPPLAPDTWAVHVAGAARVDGRSLRQALLAQAITAGARLETGSARLWASRHRVQGVTVGSTDIDADVVVAATGAWTDQFLQPTGVSLGVRPQRGQIVHLNVAPADTRGWPAVVPTQSSHYMLAFDDSRIVAGATRETGAGFDYRVTAGGLAEVLREALTIAPGLATATHLETRIGFRPMGPDIRPLLGTIDGQENLVVATGLGASGLTMGPLAGEIASTIALGKPADLDLTPFDPLRAASRS